MKKKNVVKEYIVSYDGIYLLMHLIREGDYLIPTAVKVVESKRNIFCEYCKKPKNTE